MSLAMELSTTLRTKWNMLVRLMAGEEYVIDYYPVMDVYHVGGNKKHAQVIKDIADLIDRNGKEDFGSQQVRGIRKEMTGMNAEEQKDYLIGKGMGWLNGFFVLRRDKDLLCVAQISRGSAMLTLTTPKKHRRQGHARRLLMCLREFVVFTDVHFASPVYPELRPLFASAGWVKPEWTPPPECKHKHVNVDMVPPASVSRFLKDLQYSSQHGMMTYSLWEGPEERNNIVKHYALLGLSSDWSIAVPKR